jgi:biopolymer transport protein ExbB/TolQ
MTRTPLPERRTGRLALALAPLLLAAPALAQEAAEPGLPLLDVLAMGGWITWPIYGLLLVGVALSISRLLVIRIDRGRDHALDSIGLQGRPARELHERLRTLAPSPLIESARDMLAQLLRTRNPDSMDASVQRFLTLRQDNFRPYENWLSFLSESAGALGLLGTVLGMFQTFFGGTLDKDKILHGMGIALITTLVGIVVSLLLNLVLTLVRNVFTAALDTQYHRLTEIRQAMLSESALEDDRRRRADDQG